MTEINLSNPLFGQFVTNFNDKLSQILRVMMDKGIMQGSVAGKVKITFQEAEDKVTGEYFLRPMFEFTVEGCIPMKTKVDSKVVENVALERTIDGVFVRKVLDNQRSMFDEEENDDGEADNV